jgi:predicted enzyme related to lactoylglutathione lyase
MNVNPIIWCEIYVQNMGRAKAFYEAVFQFKLEKLNNPAIEMWSFAMAMDKVGAGGALVKMDGVASGGNGTIVYFSCADCAVEAARAVAHGGQVMHEKFAIGEYGFIALLVDTEGNVIGLHSLT